MDNKYFGQCKDCGMHMTNEDFHRHELATCEEYRIDNKVLKIGDRIITNSDSGMIDSLHNQTGTITNIKPLTKYGPQGELCYSVLLDRPIHNPITKIKKVGLEYHMIGGIIG